MFRGRLKYLVGVCGATAVVAIGLATAFAANSPTGAVSAPSEAVARLGSAARADFRVFSLPQAGSEEVGQVSEALKGLDTKLDLSSVRVAQASGDLQVRVVGDSQSVCLTLRIPGELDGGGCSPEADAAAPATPIIMTTGYPPGESSGPGGQRAVGVLFPDGISVATVTAASGSRRTLDIVNNTVAFVADDGDVLSWSGPEGHVYNSAIGG